MTWLGRTRRVHFVGIGGIGMSGIAELLLNLGYEVSGSDVRRSDVADRLARLGARVAIGHEAANVGDADVVVVSSAVAATNPEVVEAKRRRVPVIPRAEMLAELMRLRFGIAIAGAHGKTTTTSMIALILERAGLDPTAVIGGRLSAFGSNARLGRGEYMVAEADESDRSFLKLSPSIAVITNIDREHLEAYGSFDGLVDAFADFAGRVPFYGAVIACVDDPPVRDLLPRLERRTITYGFSDGAAVQGLNPVSDGWSARCRIRYSIPGVPGGAGDGDIVLKVPGVHNLQNALAAVACTLDLGVSFSRIADALAGFAGAERRYELRGSAAGVTVVDDYGHHPTEIAAVLRAARSANPSRLVVVFQPHRYSRTRDLMDEFGPALALADVVVLTDIYAAGEAALPGITVEALAGAIRRHVGALHVVPPLTNVAQAVRDLVKPGDLVLTLGAGSIAAVGDQILGALNKVAS
ncbi:MAG TPA: UDP-N-acetylmuramate--L-alanine ligase [Vicinamibacterales bacterium]|nr:UDP-N-acetylmuramate--L-alanine ligase [Vicinamibacterales bacterium]